MRHIECEGEVVTICAWKSDKVEASQLAALFRFRGDKIYEERWFVDTSSGRAPSEPRLRVRLLGGF